MKCFRNDVVDWVIAETSDEATKILLETYGQDSDEPVDKEGYWAEVDPQSELSINDENGPWQDGSYPLRTQTVAQWIEERGKGFLCSTEY